MVPEYSNRATSPGPDLRVGVIGASGWADVSHLPALTATPGLRLTAVSTSREDSARQLAVKWGVAHHFTSAVDLAHCPDVDLITISVKAPAHRGLIEQVLDAGKPVLCEWPLGTSAAESAYLAGLFADRDVLGSVGLQATAHPVLQQLGRIVRDGGIGTLLAATVTSTRAGKDPLPASSAYTLQTENGAGMAQILGGHSIAALATATGVPLRTLATGAGRTRVIQSVRDIDDGEQVIATSPDSATATVPIGPIDAALSLADGDIEPGTVITLIGTKGRIQAATSPSHELRLRQPQMADWTAALTTSEAMREFASQPNDLPLAARNPSRLYQAIRNDLRHATTTAPTANDAVAVHNIIDGWRPADGV